MSRSPVAQEERIARSRSGAALPVSCTLAILACAGWSLRPLKAPPVSVPQIPQAGGGAAPAGAIAIDRKSTRLNSSHIQKSRMPSSA